MLIPKLLDGSSPRAMTLALAFGAMLALPACNVNVKKDGEGQEKKVDIETPIADFTSARVRTCGM